MFFKTLKSKILFIIFIALLLSTTSTIFIDLIFYKNNKSVSNKACNSIAEAYAIKIDSILHRLEDFARNLAVLGETFHNLNSQNQNRLDKAVERAFSINDATITFSGGIWYEPYAIKAKQKYFCSFAYLKDNKFLIDKFPANFEYIKQDWYWQNKQNITFQKPTSISKPYVDYIGTKALMITVASGIFDQNQQIVGISTVDWLLDDVIANLQELKPTKNSFVLFANTKYDFVLALNYKNNVQNYVGKSLKEVPWYNKNLKNESKFTYNNIEYITFTKQLCNDFILFINVPTQELYHALNTLFLVTCFIFLFAIIISTLAIYFVLRKNITKPIEYLISKALEIGEGNFSVKMDLKNPKEFSILAEAFNKMTNSLQDHINKLAIAEAKKKNFDSELKIARTIQLSNLKKGYPSYPYRQDIDIYATMEPAKQVGGDFYDYFFLDENHFVFLIADVSDKGVPAALFMMESKTIIKNCIERTFSLKEAIENANKLICQTNDAGFFVTAFIAILDTDTGVVEYVNAGHNKPLLNKVNEQYNYLETKSNVALGVMEVSYNVHKLQLKDGDSLFLYTDGITEAQNDKKEFYGIKKLQDILNKKSSYNSIDIIKKVHDDVFEFANGVEQYDDMTMLNIIFCGKDKNKFVTTADVNSWSIVRDFLLKNMTDNKILKEKQNKVLLASEEIFVNVANYAYDKVGGKVIIKINKTDLEYNISFIDSGKKYNPLERKDPNINLALEDRQIGGLGIFLTKKMVDKVEYKYEDKQNILSLSIKI